MSRSVRKTPKIGRCGAASEKYDKAKAHRRHRQAVKSSLKTVIAKDTEQAVQAREHPRSGRAIFAKDGKQWIGSLYPEEMRK